MGIHISFTEIMEVKALKKILSASVAVLLILASLVSCASNEDEQSNSDIGNYSDNAIYNESDLGAIGDPNANAGTPSGDNANAETPAGDSANAGTPSTDNGGSSNTTTKPAVSVTESSAGLAFELNADGQGYTLVGKGTCTATSIVIDGHSGLPVTRIGYGAFSGDKKITSVKIGNYVESIGDYAFENCSGITSLTIGDNVKIIEDYCFRYCTGLTSINLGKSMQRICYGAFYKASNIATITLPDTVRSIEEYAFDKTAYYDDQSKWSNKVLYIGKHLIKGDNSISGTYTVKSGTISIAEAAFAAYDSGGNNFTYPAITSISIPDSVKGISEKAFYMANKLGTISGGAGLEYVGAHAFTNSKYYNTSSNWKSNVLYVGKAAVAGKTSISGAITIADGTKAIADMAFASCSNATGITIPDSVVYVGEYSFLNCAKLANVNMGSGVKEIGAYAFKGCSALGSVTVKKSEGWKADGVAIPATEMADKSKAAIQLVTTASGKLWLCG